MAVKEQLLEVIHEIYAIEQGISWPNEVPLRTHWEPVPDAFHAQIGLNSFRPKIQLGRMILVDEVQLSFFDEDVSLFVRRLDKSKDYENDYVRHYFLGPFGAFIEEHDHGVCKDAAGLREQQVAEANRVQAEAARPVPSTIRER